MHLFNQGEKGYEELAQREDLMEILLEMGRAQGGAEITLDQVMTTLREQKEQAQTDGERG